MPTEAGRHHLYETVKHAWGADDADELMSLLPPVGWADVATKQDLVQLEARLDAKLDVRFAALDVRFADLEARLDTKLDVRSAALDVRFANLETTLEAGLKHHLYWIVGSMVGLTGIFSAVVTIVR